MGHAASQSSFRLRHVMRQIKIEQVFHLNIRCLQDLFMIDYMKLNKNKHSILKQVLIDTIQYDSEL